MPHITVQMFPGRDDRKKRDLSSKLAETVSSVLGVPEEYVSVSILDVPEAEWDERVYAEFMKNRQCLYKEPGYEVEQHG